MSDNTKCTITLSVAQAACIGACIAACYRNEETLAKILDSVDALHVLSCMGPGGEYNCDAPHEAKRSETVVNAMKSSGISLPEESPSDVVKRAIDKAAKEGTNVIGFPKKETGCDNQEGE